jgi:SAM domain (Sterile alpha motif)/Adenylate and Guanylate cyclase catalytic domain
VTWGARNSARAPEGRQGARHDLQLEAQWADRRGTALQSRFSKESKLKRNIVPKAAEHHGSARQQIAGWLEKLGMSEYVQRFAENRIDLSVLPELTDQHLKDLGIALGDRLKILRAIRELSGAALASPQPAFTEPKAQDTAERRQVTVMFSDLVGSTALSARPEDLREVISAYQKCVAETVQRFGGFVAKYMGDGVLVYFGYPQAHEDDAERAVRTGRDLIHAALDATPDNGYRYAGLIRDGS